MIEIKDVTFTYAGSDKPSLQNFSLTIPKRQCVLFCGESGSGKSTATMLINGLIPHYFEGEMKGTVKVQDLEVKKSELYDIAKHVGSVFQNPRSQFFCVDTTSEIAFGCENMGFPEEKILERVDKVRRDLNLDPLMDRNIFELSGGEKQKIACASVSALDPDVYVLDEPVSNLDVDAIEELKGTIALWKSRGKTVIIAEHRLYWLTDLCDRVVYMKDGQVGFDCSMQELKKFTDEKLKSYGLRGLHLIMEQKEKIGNSKEEAVLKNFSFSYGDTEAFSMEDIKLPLGEIIAIIGHNGSGKSTFSRCICGLEKKFKGFVEIKDKKYKRRDLLKKGYLVMQDVNHQLFSETVEEEIQLGIKNENESLTESILEDLDLQDFRKCHPMSLSGGQKQRVAIASSILAGKEFLVFDEPTSGLDYRHMVQTGECLEKLKGDKTVLIVTHDPELVCRYCTHVLMLDHGKVKLNRTMDEECIQRVRDFFIK